MRRCESVPHHEPIHENAIKDTIIHKHYDHVRMYQIGRRNGKTRCCRVGGYKVVGGELGYVGYLAFKGQEMVNHSACGL